MLLLSKLVLGLCAVLSSNPFNRTVQNGTIDCFDRPSVRTLENLVDCFNNYTVPKDSYSNFTAYTTAQPSSSARTAWNVVITSILTVDDNCTSSDVPPSLKHFYRVTLFTEKIRAAKSYCVLSEVGQAGGHYANGWGLLVVPSSRAAVSRFVHISAPHPFADKNTPQQAAYVFKNTGSKSLFVAGRQRAAYAGNSCVGSQYYKTDASHDTAELFFDAMKGIHHWQETSGGGCPSASCAYIQLHGKVACPTDNTFLSTGLRRDGCSDHWYSTVDSPVRRIRSALDASFPTWNNSLPSDSSCHLIAAKNVFGRFLNGVPEGSVCATYASCDSVTGQFVHIEQNPASRHPVAFGNWSRAVNRAFDATCRPPMRMDETTLLCS